MADLAFQGLFFRGKPGGMKISVFALFFLVASVCFSAPIALPLQAPDLFSKKEVTVKAQGKKAVVVAFLSAVCPCSDSHMQELSSLAKEYGDFEFIAVHSNVDEEEGPTKTYFTENKLPFPIVQDTGAKLADQFKALKTPHVFVVAPGGDILYQGGVSSSKDFARADRKYLREALSDLHAGKAVKTPEGRTLGCVISRGEKNVW